MVGTMGTVLLRIAYTTILLGSAAFVTVGPYGAWPIPGLGEQAAAIADAVEAAAATDADAAQACTTTTCIAGMTLPVVMPISPPATVVESTAAARSIDTPAAVEAVSSSIAVPAVPAVARAAGRSGAGPDAAVVIAPTDRQSAETDTPRAAAAPQTQAAAPHARAHANATVRVKEHRPRQVADKASEKAQAAKPKADSDWAIRQVFNRGG